MKPLKRLFYHNLFLCRGLKYHQSSSTFICGEDYINLQNRTMQPCDLNQIWILMLQLVRPGPELKPWTSWQQGKVTSKIPRVRILLTGFKGRGSCAFQEFSISPNWYPPRRGDSVALHTAAVFFFLPLRIAYRNVEPLRLTVQDIEARTSSLWNCPSLGKQNNYSILKWN